MPTIDPGLSINELVTRYPSAIAVLNAFGLDTCCGGALSLRDAAADARVALDELIVAIVAGVSAARTQRAGGL